MSKWNNGNSQFTKTAIMRGDKIMNVFQRSSNSSWNRSIVHYIQSIFYSNIHILNGESHYDVLQCTPGHLSLLLRQCGRPLPPQVKSKSLGNTDQSNVHLKKFLNTSRRNSLESHENERQLNCTGKEELAETNKVTDVNGVKGAASLSRNLTLLQQCFIERYSKFYVHKGFFSAIKKVTSICTSYVKPLLNFLINDLAKQRRLLFLGFLV